MRGEGVAVGCGGARVGGRSEGRQRGERVGRRSEESSLRVVECGN